MMFLAGPAVRLAAAGCLAWRWLVGTIVVTAIGGCANFLSEPAWHAREPNRSWVVVTSTRTTSLAPGVVLELPDVPYRLWFADAEGQFFRPSVPLTFRNGDGVVLTREGGLYVKNSAPGQGLVWLSPALGHPTLPSAPRWQVEVRQYIQGP